VTYTLKDTRGFALILTILIISLIMVLTLQFNNAMWAGLYSSANLRDTIRCDLIARSGIHCAMAVLSDDAASSGVDSLQETWAQTKALSLNSASMFEEGRFDVSISDLSGKIQINHLINEKGEYNDVQKMLLTRFLSLEPFRLEPEAVGNLIDAIKDWIDPDNEVTRFGAENGYYQSLENPYACKNGPIDSLGQIRFIKGMTRALFFGTEDRPGIADSLTVYGDGKININTAGPLVLRALSEDIDTGMVEDMMAYRLDKKNDLTDPVWYHKVSGMGDVTINPALIKTSSDTFEIESEGMTDVMSKQKVTAVVKRGEGSSLKTVLWNVD
jgi:general secretion pathway protein K